MPPELSGFQLARNTELFLFKPLNPRRDFKVEGVPPGPSGNPAEGDYLFRKNLCFLGGS